MWSFRFQESVNFLPQLGQSQAYGLKARPLVKHLSQPSLRVFTVRQCVLLCAEPVLQVNFVCDQC